MTVLVVAIQICWPSAVPAELRSQHKQRAEAKEEKSCDFCRAIAKPCSRFPY